MIIDVFCHIVPDKYKEAVYKLYPNYRPNFGPSIEKLPTLFDLDSRFRMMDKYEGMRQVLTMSLFGAEALSDPKKGVDMVKIANDEMAELIVKHPDRFVAGIATLPIENIEASLREIDRTIKDLNFKGIQLHTPINGKSMDSPEFLPIYEKMVQYDLPILVHPGRPPHYPDYKSENKSYRRIYQIFGWPYETTAAMTRLALSGIFDKWPRLKIVTHHCGGMVPFFSDRILTMYEYCTNVTGERYLDDIKKPPMEYFKMFYADTALGGGASALMCGYDFFGARQMLFATDYPFDGKCGEIALARTVDAVGKMKISAEEKKMIYEDNAKKLLHLSV